eukprot:NODE_72_length_23514_cov_0.560624.p4 type:complete len:467 gc:universal NODE_72_length_23514_cov_0.560624:15226-13826(-)
MKFLFISVLLGCGVSREETLNQFRLLNSQDVLPFITKCRENSNFTCAVDGLIDSYCFDIYRFLIMNPIILLEFLKHKSGLYNIDVLHFQLYYIVEKNLLSSFRIISNHSKIPVNSRISKFISFPLLQSLGPGTHYSFISYGYKHERNEMVKELFINNPDAYTESFRLKPLKPFQPSSSTLIRSILVLEYKYCPLELILYRSNYIYQTRFTNYIDLLLKLSSIAECQQTALQYLKMTFQPFNWMILLANIRITPDFPVFEALCRKFNKDFYKWSKSQLDLIIPHLSPPGLLVDNLQTLASVKWIAYSVEKGFLLFKFPLNDYDLILQSAIANKYHKATSKLIEYLPINHYSKYISEDYMIEQIRQISTGITNMNSKMLLNELLKQNNFTYTGLIKNTCAYVDGCAQVIERYPNMHGHLQGLKGNCSICLNRLSNDARILRCGHYFHSRCVEQWREKVNSCPICRVSM